MLMTGMFGDRLWDDFFGGTHFPAPRGGAGELMKTDIKDVENGYELTMNLPGIDKENVKAELKNGCLTISANSSQSTDKKDEDGHYIRRERYSGSCSRSFFVGENVKQEDIKAKFENGILHLFVPKNEALPDTERYIAIEG